METNSTMNTERNQPSPGANLFSKKGGDASERATEGNAKTSGFKTMGDAIDKAGEKIQHLDGAKIKAQASEWMHAASEKTQEVDASVKAFIRERPLTVLLGAAAVGFAVGKIVTATKKFA